MSRWLDSTPKDESLGSFDEHQYYIGARNEVDISMQGKGNYCPIWVKVSSVEGEASPEHSWKGSAYKRSYDIKGSCPPSSVKMLGKNVIDVFMNTMEPWSVCEESRIECNLFRLATCTKTKVKGSFSSRSIQCLS